MVGVGLNLSFVVAETVYGLISGSMALIADAGHNMGDVLGLLAAWGASKPRTSPILWPCLLYTSPSPRDS